MELLLRLAPPTFALQLVHHGDVVQGDDGQHGLGPGQRQTLFEDGGDAAGHQLLSQALVVGDEHDDDQQPVAHRQRAAAQKTCCQHRALKPKSCSAHLPFGAEHEVDGGGDDAQQAGGAFRRG